MNYQTFEPSPELSPLIKCYWTLDAPKIEPSEIQTIVPDGCMEMIFHHGDLYRQYLQDGNSIIQPRCFVIGQLTRPLEIEPTGKIGIFSVRFHPFGFTPFTTKPIKAFENSAIDLSEVFGKEGLDIATNILKAATSQKRLEIIDAFLQNRLTQSQTIDQIVESTVETILTANGQISIHELSQQTRVNRRQLERKFAAVIGLSPKRLSKTIRLQAVFKMLLNKQYKNLTDLAYEGDYYDQAHFVKDFKELTGFTPKEFYKDNLKMSSLFYSEG